MLHPGAEADLRDAAEYYRERADSALSQVLFTEFERSMQLLVRHPLVGVLWPHGKRCLFPYSVIYAVAGEEIRVLAVAHHSRRPGYWRKRSR